MSKLYKLISFFGLGASIFGTISYASKFSTGYYIAYIVLVFIILTSIVLSIFFDETIIRYFEVDNEGKYYVNLFFLVSGLIFSIIFFQWV